MRYFGCSIVLAASFVLTAFQPLPAFGELPRTPAASQRETSSSAFKLHIPNEPTSLDPLLVESSDAGYFLYNVSRGLYSYSTASGLRTEGAEKCSFVTKLKIRCSLNKSAKWSDGSNIVAEDYVRAFRRIVGKTSKARGVELLKNLKNAVLAQGGKISADQLGVTALSNYELEFNFDKPDQDFLYKLTASLLVPVKAESFPTREASANAVVNGPYKISKWIAGRRVILEPNPYYILGNKNRPRVEILFVDDDQTGVHLYEQGELSFLRRLPTTEIPKSKNRVDFKQIPIARFDYIGFGTDLLDQPKLREALSYALDFQELAKIYDALGMPGCPSLPLRLMADEPCVKFDLARAKKAWDQVPASLRSKRYKLVFSKLGGDDVKKGAEWFQAQWKKHLGAAVDIEAMEQGVYLSTMRSNPPPIFRKGVGLERPTCLAALETLSKGGSENFIHYDNPEYEGLLDKLGNAKKEHEKKSLCSQGIKMLLSDFRLIPLGRIHFTLLARPEWLGWELNEMNQLDLSQLHFRP